MPSLKRIKPGMLTLGWHVNASLSPKYWLDHGTKPGRQQDSDLVMVPAETMAFHTAIVAQSGSGKSFFLGRLVEEILLQTKARCLILDPNADFRRFSDPADASQWKTAAYNNKTGRGLLPHESTRTAFASRWAAIKKHLSGGPYLPKSDGEQLRLPWPSVSVEFLAEEADPKLRIDIYHCHEFVKMIAFLLGFMAVRRDSGDLVEGTSLDLIDEARMLLRTIKSSDNKKTTLGERFDPTVLELSSTSRFGALTKAARMVIADVFIDRALAAVEFISDEAERYYFGKANEYAAQRIVETNVSALEVPRSARAQLEILDLPSFADNKTAQLALNACLAREWEFAREAWTQAVKKSKNRDTRVPTFIVVDEAHNLIPLHPRGLAAETLREQFRTIAAEGRKYGLFLILCTQRPDKIDPFVISECENRAILRLGSRAVLQKAEEMLGLEDVPEAVLRKCLEFELGRGLLIGQWAKDRPLFFYAAMRRTIEGGRNLRDEYWTMSGLPLSRNPSKVKKSSRVTKTRSGTPGPKQEGASDSNERT